MNKKLGPWDFLKVEQPVCLFVYKQRVSRYGLQDHNLIKPILARRFIIAKFDFSSISQWLYFQYFVCLHTNRETEAVFYYPSQVCT